MRPNGPSPVRWRDYTLVWMVLGMGLLVSALAARWLRQEARRADEARFTGLVEQVRQDFDGISEKYQQALQRLADAIGARENFTQQHWDLQISRLDPDVDFPGLSEIQLVGVVFVTNLPPEFENLSADELDPTDKDQILPFKQANAIMTRAALRLKPLWGYIARSATEPPAQGMPGNSLKKQVPHIRAAIERQSVRVTGPRVILRDRSGRDIRGTTLVIPVPGEALAKAWSTNIAIFRNVGESSAYFTAKNFAGFRGTSAVLCGSIDWQMLIHASLRDEHPELHLDLYAYREPRTNYWLGGSGDAPTAVTMTAASFRTNDVVNMYLTKWTLALSTTPLFDKQSTGYRAYVALFGGMTITVLVAALLAVQVRGRVRQQIIAGELRNSLTELEAARTERDELGRDLHDGAIQSLYALQLGLSRTSEQARCLAPEIALRLADYRHGVGAIIADLRKFILRHEAGTQSGANLGRVLTASLDRLQPTTSAKLLADLDSDAAERLSNEQAVHLANIAREALSNSLRHSSASQVKVALGSENGTVQLEVSDDGCGFDPAKLAPGGMGLANMASRARDAGGELKLDAGPGRGTRVIVRVTVNSSVPIGPVQPIERS